jgi:hypothetical protein
MDWLLKVLFYHQVNQPDNQDVTIFIITDRMDMTDFIAKRTEMLLKLDGEKFYRGLKMHGVKI